MTCGMDNGRCTVHEPEDLQAADPAAAREKQVRRKIDNGSVWTEELAELLAQYERQRDQYPTFESFFPRFIDFFNTYSQNLAA